MSTPIGADALTGCKTNLRISFFFMSTNSGTKIVTTYTPKIGIPGLGKWHVGTN